MTLYAGAASAASFEEQRDRLRVLCREFHAAYAGWCETNYAMNNSWNDMERYEYLLGQARTLSDRMSLLMPELEIVTQSLVKALREMDAETAALKEAEIISIYDEASFKPAGATIN